MPTKRNNSLFSNSFFIFIIRFFPSLANLMVVIWYSRHLPEAIYGSYQHFWIQLNVLYPLACYGIHVLLVNYPLDFIVTLLKRIPGKYYLFYSIWIVALGGVFAMLQAGPLGMPLLVPFLFIIAYSLTIILESFLIVARSYKTMIFTNVIYSVAYWAIHWHILKNGFSLQALFSYLLLITLVRLIVYASTAIWNTKKIIIRHDATEAHNIPQIRSFWLHMGFYDVSQILFSWIDKFIVSLVLTAQLSAIYFNGSMNIPFLPLLLSATGSAVLMQLAGTNKNDETADTIRFMNQLGRTLSCIVFPLFLFLWFFRSELITTLLSAKYIPAIPIFAASILVLPLRAYSFTTVLQRLHKGRIINIGAIADLTLACLLMYPLYKWIGLPGVALSFVITTYLQSAFYLFCSAKLLHTSPLQLVPYLNWLIKLIVFASLFITIRYVCNMHFTGQFALILGGGVMVAMIGISLIIEFLMQRKYGSI